MLGAVAAASLWAPITTAQPQGLEEHLSPQATSLVINGFVGAALGGIHAAIQDESLLDGIAAGAAGGFLIGGAKVMIGNDADTAWQAKFLASTGTALIRGGGSLERSLEEYVLPLGPLRLRAREPHVVLSPEDVVMSAYYLLGGASLELEASLRYGVLVYSTDDLPRSEDGFTPGRASGQVVAIDRVRRSVSSLAKGGPARHRDPVGAVQRSGTLRHELVHAIQHVSYRSLPAPRFLQGWLRDAGDDLYLDLEGSVRQFPFGVQGLLLPRDYRLHEIEARRLSNE